MNEFHAEKQKHPQQETSVNDAYINSDDMHIGEKQAEEQTYTFISNGHSNTHGYITPEGAHGCVYSPSPVFEGNGVGRKLIIATCAVGCLLLMMGFCFLSGWAVVLEKSRTQGIPASNDGQGGNKGMLGTSEGFVIVEETGETTEDEATEKVQSLVLSDPSEPLVGLTLIDVDSIRAAMFYFNSPCTGVYVYDSASDVLKYGDLILTVNGVELKKSDAISVLLRDAKVGDTVTLEICRDKTQMTVAFVLTEEISDDLTEAEPSLAPAA